LELILGKSSKKTEGFPITQNISKPASKIKEKEMSNRRVITLKRDSHLPEATLGTLKISWSPETTIQTLENPERETSVDSRIPAGTYQCAPYSGIKYKDVYIVKDVPGRTAILFHWGNTEKDTEGCILLGNKKGTLAGQPAVLESKKCFERLRTLLGKEPFTIVVED